jgi:endoglucanase
MVFIQLFVDICGRIMKLQLVLLVLVCATLIHGKLLEPSQLPLSTRGRWMVDKNGDPVHLACVNWYGAHQLDYIVSGPESQSIKSIIDYIVDKGFNCIRLQWSMEMMIKNPRITNATLIRGDMGLFNKTAFEIYDYIVALSVVKRLAVVLDNHMLDAEWCCSDYDDNGLWYNRRFTELAWLTEWKKLVRYYKSSPYVIGADLRNEPRNVCHGNDCIIPTWGTGNPDRDWKNAAEKCGNEILSESPHLLIFVEGLQYATDLRGVARFPIRLRVPNKLVYSAHDYSWFHPGVITYETYVMKIDMLWGFIFNEYPVWMGEFGTCHNNVTCIRGNDGAGRWWGWFLRFVKERKLSWAYWALNGSQARGTGREFGTLETFGIMNVHYNATGNEQHLRDIQSIQNLF